MRKQVRYVDGFSESLWVSLAVKSVRLGWPAGLEAAARRLSRSRIKETLTVQVFEDVYPSEDEVAQVLAECRALDFEALCLRDTRHAVPGLTEASVPVVLEWGGKRTQKTEGPRLYPEARKLGLYLTWRLFSEFDAWLATRHLCRPGRRRGPDPAPWVGMIEAARDGHTAEGKQLARETGQEWVTTLLSGSEDQHLVLAFNNLGYYKTPPKQPA